jgi:hypothetical protein
MWALCDHCKLWGVQAGALSRHATCVQDRRRGMHAAQGGIPHLDAVAGFDSAGAGSAGCGCAGAARWAAGAAFGTGVYSPTSALLPDDPRTCAATACRLKTLKPGSARNKGGNTLWAPEPNASPLKSVERSAFP